MHATSTMVPATVLVQDDARVSYDMRKRAVPMLEPVLINLWGDNVGECLLAL